MNKAAISIAQSNVFSGIFADYVEHPEKLRSFFKYPFAITSFRKAIADKSKEFIDRKILVEVLTSQYKNITKVEPVTLNLKLLSESSTFTVCTGHQLCLFTGPLYFIYKIITTINLSEELKSNYPEFDFVPVYWMASEDHDFEEINHIHLFGKKLTWEGAVVDGKGQIPVGIIKTGTMISFINELKMMFGITAFSNQLVALFEKAYLGNANLAEATRCLVDELFGKYGLIVLDPSDKRLKEQFGNIMKDDLINQTNYNHVQATVQQFIDMGMSVQVNPREKNCFYLKDGLRKRIVNNDSANINPDTEIACTSQLLDEIELHPEYFSPNVLLRPLYQQKILPNLAYVGGPAEIAYWLEYKGMFDYHQINFPVLIPRNFAVLLDTKTEQQWTKLGFNDHDYFRETEDLIKSFVLKSSQIQLSLSSEQAQVSEIYSSIVSLAERIDPTLKANVLAEQQKMINALKQIEAKFIKAEKLKMEREINQIKKVKEKLFPEGQLQERTENFIPWYLKQGPGFIEMLRGVFKPFEPGIVILSD
jgi:bacillithiol biosynthesis cysteine-adding enzyme BshC